MQLQTRQHCCKTESIAWVRAWRGRRAQITCHATVCEAGAVASVRQACVCVGLCRPLIIWTSHLASFVVVRLTDGFRGLDPGGAWRGPLRWEICYNLTMLRLLSYSLDLCADVKSGKVRDNLVGLRRVGCREALRANESVALQSENRRASDSALSNKRSQHLNSLALVSTILCFVLCSAQRTASWSSGRRRRAGSGAARRCRVRSKTTASWITWPTRSTPLCTWRGPF